MIDETQSLARFASSAASDWWCDHVSIPWDSKEEDEPESIMMTADDLVKFAQRVIEFAEEMAEPAQGYHGDFVQLGRTKGEG
ncbi:MAG: hypothetical protein KA533_07385 [Sphingobium sp.]|nr:hypothetical protein [Sphingobium sp.]MBP6111714.1 hypothetical protein [Sphingobium sp.]MBP8671605.1 hypothetical protein [Sphingobium sp.]MBP9158631.1 hypothetical protein [Sphingobium sp.]MCC6482443.1 hypothetical protein [Sphingomonadaceae bacterium]